MGPRPSLINYRLRFLVDYTTFIGENWYPSIMSVAALKQILISIWPRDQRLIPVTVNDMTLITGGRVMEDHMTLFSSMVNFDQSTDPVTTVLVIVHENDGTRRRRRIAQRRQENQRLNPCGCSVQ